MERYIAIDNVCGWPKLTLMDDGSINLDIHNKPSHGSPDGSAECCKSVDGGKTYGPLNVIEDDPTRGYSYPAMFKTRDGRLLLGYCRGDEADGNHLCRIGIAEIEIGSIE